MLGDAATCFNPIYGQGMTVGIKGAVLLRSTLQKRLQGRRFGPGTAGSVLHGFSRVSFQSDPVCLYAPLYHQSCRPLSDFLLRICHEADQTELPLVRGYLDSAVAHA